MLVKLLDELSWVLLGFVVMCAIACLVDGDDACVVSTSAGVEEELGRRCFCGLCLIRAGGRCKMQSCNASNWSLLPGRRL